MIYISSISKFSLWSFFFCLHVFIGYAQNKNELYHRQYIAYRVIDSITIDGKEDESSWSSVDWSEDFIDIEGVKRPKLNTRIKMLWNDQYLFVFAKLDETDIWATIKKRDAVIFHDNDFEVFIDPDGDTHNYYEIEINAFNTVWDLFLTKPYREGNVVLNDWSATGMKSAVAYRGTINNPNDVDSCWTLEIAIPWTVFKKSYYENITPNDTYWRINFSRVNWDFQLKEGAYERKKDEKGKLLHEYNWVWSPTGEINMHMPEHWGYVYFSSKKAGQEDVFSISEDEKIKWELYKIHRAQKKYQKRKSSSINKIENIERDTIVIGNQIIKPKIEINHTGYNIMVKSPFTNKVLIIKEDGKFIEKQ